MDNKNNKSFAYKLGQAFAAIAGICIMTILIALTARLVFWILGGIL